MTREGPLPPEIRTLSRSRGMTEFVESRRGLSPPGAPGTTRLAAELFNFAQTRGAGW
jgi:hypothetical protein